VRKEEVLHRVKEERNIIHTVKRRKANRIGDILRRNCLRQDAIEGRIGGIEVTVRQERRRMRLLCYLKEKRVYSKLKEETLDLFLWRTRF
jgi:hypothetical protein